ncbi:hypothetical protein MITS9508_00034 [Synechococcus sp. MIT S9508]|nr:hypothetical protein MITS9508_00034 [Synechococcus sp. MIT S9508]
MTGFQASLRYGSSECMVSPSPMLPLSGSIGVAVRRPIEPVDDWIDSLASVGLSSWHRMLHEKQ